MIKGKKVFILGMARSGFEAAKILAKDNEVLVTDMNEQDINQVQILEELGVKIVICKNPINLLDNSFDIMIKNPGIKYDHPTVLKAKDLGIKVINEVELAYKYMNKNVNIIGVTGSNGKTTTVTLIYNIMKEAGLPVHLGGNIGTPLCHFVKDIKENDYNLNIPRYVDTFEEEAEVDIPAVQKEIDALEAELAEIQAKMRNYLKELGY